uniref:Uncharacterized protein n=1 Tax=Caenorhabditis japonica TaxID=281687 RepID=A0A8R1ELM6_CAEJA
MVRTIGGMDQGGQTDKQRTRLCCQPQLSTDFHVFVVTASSSSSLPSSFHLLHSYQHRNSFGFFFCASLRVASHFPIEILPL